MKLLSSLFFPIKKTPSRLSRLPSLFHFQHFLVWYRQGTFKNGRRAGLGTGTLRGGGSSENWRAWSKQRSHLAFVWTKRRYISKRYLEKMWTDLQNEQTLLQKWYQNMPKHVWMSNMSWNENYSKKMKVLQKNTKETLLKKPATAGSLLSQSYPAAHWVFEGACQIAKWKNNEKTPENTSPFEKGTECIQDPKFNGQNKTITKKKLSKHPNRNLSHPWIIRSVGKPRPPCLWGPGVSPSARAAWSSSVASTFHFVPPKLPLHSFILHIPSPVFLGYSAMCKMCRCVYSA